MTQAKQIKCLAYSSRLAFAFKAGVSLLICSILALLARDAKNAFGVYFLLFPLIGIITDSVLYLGREKIFKANIRDEDVSELYGLNAEELLTYAKKIPLVRLFRIIPAMLLFPLGLYSIPSPLPIIFLVSVLMGYYPAALTDVFFAKKLGIKLPSTYKLIPKFHSSIDIIRGTSITPFEDTERTKYMYGQISTYGCRNSILNPLNNSITPISSPPILSCLSNHY
ncbi:MAG: hypothetical protein K2Q34_04435 [Alphaproteobacteria bacterium]|nr:hypothetical protein [Alphaproteobacteria bacterium]